VLRSTPVVVDGDTLTLRIYHHASSTGTQSQDQDDEQAAAAAAALVPPVRVRDRSGRRRSVALMALRGSLVRVEVTGSSGLTLFSFGFK
jgi:hypothetical protein